MLRVLTAGIAVALCLSGCGGSSVQRVPGAPHLRASDLDEVQMNMLESVNDMRRLAGVAPVALSPELSRAAAAQAADISAQKRAWAWGSDWSSPYARIARAGYPGQLVAELYSQSFDTELETLTAWLQDEAWAESIRDPAATDLGFAFHQDASGMIWWVLTLGSRGGAAQ
ncbi:CAP domain-containing protein [Mangrovicoccus algicola]|uniref:CAP domain-containing protein n=1 Tax=Mangrovicoccus algicola TaxID=2771008 RepID=A0A8J7CK31_9RHOB|nr:CAP domain-containing protein [Mangrovicoccus algicola]MBE3638251.1 CAP domain-containing protein [Mangrovicoccus algicola]